MRDYNILKYGIEEHSNRRGRLLRCYFASILHLLKLHRWTDWGKNNNISEIVD